MSVTGWFRISVECKGGILITAGYEREKMSSLFSGTGEKKDCSHRRLSAVLVLDLLWFLWAELSPICPRVVCSFVRAYCRRHYALSMDVVGPRCWRTWYVSPARSRGVSRLGGGLLFLQHCGIGFRDWGTSPHVVVIGWGDGSVCKHWTAETRTSSWMVRGRRIWRGWADCMLWHRWRHRQLWFSLKRFCNH